MTPERRELLTTVGLGVLSATVVFGGVLWVVQRQLKGRMVTVRLVHGLEPETQALADRYYPIMQKATEDGVDVNMRLFPRGNTNRIDLVGALAPQKGYDSPTSRRGT
jgi:hypothetical protein